MVLCADHRPHDRTLPIAPQAIYIDPIVTLAFATVESSTIDYHVILDLLNSSDGGIINANGLPQALRVSGLAADCTHAEFRELMGWSSSLCFFGCV